MTHHLLLSCHFRDREKMQTLLLGAEAHLNFHAFYLCDVFDGKLAESFSYVLKRPTLDLWQSFIVDNFDHETLCSLLESIVWDYPDLVTVSFSGVLGRMESFWIPAYRKLVDSMPAHAQN